VPLFADEMRQCRMSGGAHFHSIGRPFPNNRIDCSWMSIKLQRRDLSIDKEQLWAASAAAVTLSKHREQKSCDKDAGSSQKLAGHLQSVTNEAPPASSGAGAVGGMSLDSSSGSAA
jgi:hypothetical protein